MEDYAFVDARMQHLSYFISTTVQQIMTEKTRKLLKSKHIDPITVSKNLEKALSVSLKSEREKYLQDTIDKLEQTIAERNSYEIELKSLLKKSSVKNSYLQEQNTMLREKYFDMKKTSSLSNDKFESRSSFISTQLQSKDLQIDSINEFLDNTRTTCRLFKKELNQMKTIINSQLRMIHQQFKTISHDVMKYIKICNNQQLRRSSLRMKEYDSTLVNETDDTKRCTLICNALLDILHEIHPTNRTLQTVKASSAYDHIAEIEIAIREIPAMIKSEAISEIKDDIVASFPECQSIKSEPIPNIINNIVNKKLKAQEDLYSVSLHKLRKKERELQDKLQKVLDNVPKEPIYTHMSTLSMVANADHEKIKWEKRKKYLDETIKIVESLSPRKSPQSHKIKK